MMKVVLAAFSTPGIRAIECLIAEGVPPGNITLMSHQHGRNKPLIEFAKLHEIETIVDPVTSSRAHSWMRNNRPDVLFSFYFRDIIPKDFLSIPSLGAYNLHPSLLPKYRGAFSCPWVIINGEEYTGFTYHKMEAAVDSGDILYQKRVKIRNTDTAYTLYHRVLIEGLAAFPKVLELLDDPSHVATPQRGRATYYRRAVPFGGYVDLSWERAKIDRFIRAMQFPPFPGALVRLSNGGAREVQTMEDFDDLVSSGITSQRGSSNR